MRELRRITDEERRTLSEDEDEFIDGGKAIYFPTGMGIWLDPCSPHAVAKDWFEEQVKIVDGRLLEKKGF